ncbi:hypothetical protein Tco_1448874 [Tanacetum coccineum]
MAASAIAISSDSSDESVGSPPSWVIIFGNIPLFLTSVVAPETSTIAPVISSAAPVVETTLVASPTGLCGLIPYSDSDSDSPDEMSSPEHISPLPAISPFLCTDSSEAPDSSDGPPSQDPYVATVARWRSRVTAPILIRPGEAIPFGRPYRTHLNRPRKLLTARKRVGPLPARRLASRRVSPRSSDHRSSSSSSSLDSSPVYSSDSYSSEASIEEDTEIDPIETEVDMELGIGDGDDVRDHVEIDPRDVRDDTKEYEADTSAGDTVEVGIDPMSFEDMPIDLDDAVRDFYHHMSEVRIDRIVRIETVQRRLEADQLIARGQRVSMIKRIDSLRLENLKVHAMLDIKRDRVNHLRLHVSLSQEEFR